MTIDELVAVHDGRPFRPFTIYLADGRHLTIPTAAFMAPKPTSPWAFVWHVKDNGYTLVNVSSIVRLEFEGIPEEVSDR
jgi:hypothetical protein